MIDCDITLIAELDEGSEEKKSVIATVSTVSQKEYFAAAQVGFKAEFKAEIWFDEYEGQRIVELEDFSFTTRRFSVYRSYGPRADGKIELYLTNKVGVFYDS